MGFMKRTKSLLHLQEKRSSASGKPLQLASLDEEDETPAPAPQPRRQTLQRHSRPTRIRTVTAKNMRELRELIRRRYAFDVEIWRDKDVKDYARDHLEEIMKKADALLMVIENTLEEWDRRDLFASDEEYDKFRDIQTRIRSGRKIAWSQQPPWTLSIQDLTPIRPPYELNGGPPSVAPRRGSYASHQTMRGGERSMRSPQQSRAQSQRDAAGQQRTQYASPFAGAQSDLQMEYTLPHNPIGVVYPPQQSQNGVSSYIQRQAQRTAPFAQDVRHGGLHLPQTQHAVSLPQRPSWQSQYVADPVHQHYSANRSQQGENSVYDPSQQLYAPSHEQGQESARQQDLGRVPNTQPVSVFTTSAPEGERQPHQHPMLLPSRQPPSHRRVTSPPQGQQVLSTPPQSPRAVSGPVRSQQPWTIEDNHPNDDERDV